MPEGELESRHHDRSAGRGVGPCPGERMDDSGSQLTDPASPVYSRLLPRPQSPYLAPTGKRVGVDRFQSPPVLTKPTDFKGTALPSTTS